jgi:hypothetical protein
MKFIIDHYTYNYKKTLYALNRLKGTTAEFNGVYNFDSECCQLLVETDKTEEELDHWLWSRKTVGDYIGVVAT